MLRGSGSVTRYARSSSPSKSSYDCPSSAMCNRLMNTACVGTVRLRARIAMLCTINAYHCDIYQSQNDGFVVLPHQDGALDQISLQAQLIVHVDPSHGFVVTTYKLGAGGLPDRATGRHALFSSSIPLSGISITRFISHSCEPNATFLEQQTRSRVRVLVKMIKNVQAGAQITVHYGNERWSKCACDLCWKEPSRTGESSGDE
ncbi:hypothetical protein DVH05_014627 [Phytophthora capsici]|nr:hypothetical protein DVH05_014627 [Phytophthora capsici]